MSSWSKGTKSQYSPHIVRWVNHCTSKGIDPFNASVVQGAEFLVEYFHSSTNEYSSLNTARSALSAVIAPVNGITFGKQPLICRLLKGIFREKPTLPKYTVTYDVKKVFDFIQSVNINDASLELLTKCVATILCLLSGQRSQTLSELYISYMYLDSTRVIFYIPKLLKTTRPTFHQEPLEFKAFPNNTRICPVTYVTKYIEVTKSHREDEKLFISYGKPFKAVTSTTIARWTTDILKRSGIETTTFSAHSTRHASTSNAKRNLSLLEIGKAAGWSNMQTFGKHYNRPILENFGETILSHL